MHREPVQQRWKLINGRDHDSLFDDGFNILYFREEKHSTENESAIGKEDV